mmetsp:Transcript_56055/g.62680  ORF Transcript_56055/g.62680 Transcript_56055/m.62680 type:complete len:716 (-) Transcript_56055:1429-3576(-)
MSYDSASSLDFENLLLDCLSNHFGDKSHDDSLTSESSFSGYVNEGEESDSVQYRIALLNDANISDNAYYRMRGVIARKKTKTEDNSISEDMGLRSRGTNTNKAKMISSENFTVTSTDRRASLPKFKNAVRNNVFSKQFKIRGYDFSNSFSTDSSDITSSVINKRRKIRSHSKKSLNGKLNKHNGIYDSSHHINVVKNTIRDSSFDVDSDAKSNMAVGRKISTPLNNPESKNNALNFLNENAPTLHKSVVARLRLTAYSNNESFKFHARNTSSEMNIDTADVILPSIVKKGTKIDDSQKSDDRTKVFMIELIEQVLNGMQERQVTMNRKRLVLHQLCGKFDLELQEQVVNQNGMIHKMRAKQKVALQTAFLQHSEEQQAGLKQKNELSIPTFDKFSEILKLSFHGSDDLMKMAQHPTSSLQLPVSLSLSSFVEEKKQLLPKLNDKRKRSFPYCVNLRQDKASLLQNEPTGQCLKASQISAGEAILISKASPVKQKSSSRSKKGGNYEVLAPESSLTNATNSDYPISEISSLFKLPSPPSNSRYKIPEYIDHINTQDSSDSISLFNGNNLYESFDNSNDRSAWSEMSFLSDTNRFADSLSSVSARLLEQRGSYKKKHGNQTQYNGVLPSPYRTTAQKSFNDSFDEIIHRDTPGKNLSIGEGIKSPIGVMDLFSVIDTDEEDHVFTDKEDSFVLKSPKRVASSPVYQPIFLTSRRFEI